MSVRSFAELAPYLDAAQRFHGGPDGDRALADLLTQVRTASMQYFRRHMPAHRADDCVQEILIAVHANLLSIDVATCGSYFGTAANSRLQDSRRRAVRPISALSERWVPLLAVPHLAAGSTLTERLEAMELEAAVRRACQRLPPRYRAVALSVITEGETPREYARRAGRSFALVRSQLRRARKFLRNDVELLPWRGSGRVD